MKEKMIGLILYHLLPTLILIYVGFGVFMWYFQTNYIYFPTNADFDHCTSMLDAERVNINGTRAYYKKTDGPLVVLYHGNAGSACDRAWYATKFFDPQGLSYLIVEYKGYGKNDGEPSSDFIRKDVEHMVSFIEEEGHKDVILMSESVGSGAAAYHASLKTPRTIILTTPMLSLEKTAQYHYPVYPVSLMLTEKFDVVDNLKNLDSSIHILHGTDDVIVPLKHAKELYETLGTKEKTLTIIEGAEHNDIYGTSIWSERVNALLNSLNE